MTSLILLLLAVDLSYGSGTLQLQRLASVPDAALAQQVVACTRGYGVTTLERKGEPSAVVWSKADPATDALPGTSRAERVALLSILGRKMVGAEVDVLVPQADGTRVPVTVTWEPDGVVSFESGPPVKSLLDETMTAEKIRAQFDVGEFIDLDAPWDGRAYSVVHQALSLLSKEELALLRGMPFRRAKKEGIHRAKYERGDATNCVFVYDATFLFADELFTGSAQAPRAEAVAVLTHEFGHALADVRFREKGLISKAAAEEYKRRQPEVDAAAKAFNDKVAELGPKPTARGTAELKALEAAFAKVKAETDTRFKEADRLVKQMFANDRLNAQAGRPAEKALAAVLNLKQSPTTYGRSSVREHFAECFNIFKNDPAALRRISAAAADWFAAGTHISVAGQAIDP
ncbi:MAG: hypothetical protein Q8N23_29940 [Archangium sp.]|nr:hypothetical protein [Archangium sp.]MDP3156930.1 hypothetical protein [Archangium sp.]MDP3575610.1 hypothetical protein [Archangium sp.]